jgi:hypothetical protein
MRDIVHVLYNVNKTRIIYMDRYLKSYYIIASSYGMCRKAYELKDATITHDVYDGHSLKKAQVQRPILLGDKLLLTSYATMLSPFLIPIHIKNDINKLQIHLQGLDPNDFEVNKKEHLYDYIFS